MRSPARGCSSTLGLNTSDGGTSYGGSVFADSLQTVELVEPGDHTLDWGEVTVEGVTYLPDPASIPVMLEPRIEPYVFEVVYQPQP